MADNEKVEVKELIKNFEQLSEMDKVLVLGIAKGMVISSESKS